MAKLSIKNLYKKYGSVTALKDINLEIDTGEFIVFVGPSGCGKSTLLRTIAGLETISSGTLHLDGRLINDVEPSQRELAMVFQSYALYPHLTVRENMGYALKLAKTPKEEIRRVVEEAAAKLQLTPYLDRKPFAMSGGQRQRVAIGRAIVRNPKLFLFDEPLSNLDAALRVQMRLEIAALNEMLKTTTMIYVTHDQVEAMTMADRIVVLRDGIIEQVGTPLELYENPQSKFVAQFIGSPKMNILENQYAARYGANAVGIRPEHMVIGNDGPWKGRVLRTEQLGSDSFTYVEVGLQDSIIIREPGRASSEAGTEITFGPQDNHILRFNEAGQRL